MRVPIACHISRLSVVLPIIALSSVLLLTACSHEKQEEPIVTVQLARAQKRTIEQTVTAEAILFPSAQSAIVPKISAPVKKFFVNRGNKVRRGQLLAILENRDLAAAVQENKGAYDQAQAAYAITTSASLPEEIEKARGDAQSAKQALDAEQKLYSSRVELYKQGALPRKDLDQATVALTQARNQYDLAQRHVDALMAIGKQQSLKAASGQLEAAEGKYRGAEAQLGYSEIRSPINGVVTDRPLYAGEMTAAGTPLLTIMDTSSVVARAHIPQDQAALLKPGDKVKIEMPEESGPIDGRITIVSPALDPNSTTVEVWAQASNPAGKLRPGTNVRLSILARIMPNAIVIPASSVLTTPEAENYVMVAGSDGRAHQKMIKAGVRQGEEIQIVSGLNEGEWTVVSGGYGLPDKTRIRTASDQESANRGQQPDGKQDEKKEK